MLPLVRPVHEEPRAGRRAPRSTSPAPPRSRASPAQYFANSEPKTSSKAMLRRRTCARGSGRSAALVGSAETLNARVDAKERADEARRAPGRTSTSPAVRPRSVPMLAAGRRRRPRRPGVDNLSLMDHYLQIGMAGRRRSDPMLEGYTTLGYLAAHTDDRRAASSSMTGVTYRHPGLLAKIVSTLDVLSGGRAALGIGAAWYEREHRGLRRALPAAEGAVRAARGDPADRRARCGAPTTGRSTGTHYQLAETINSPQPLQPHPDHGRWRRREEDAAPGRAVRRRLQPLRRRRHRPPRCGTSSTCCAGTVRELGTEYDRIRRTVMLPQPFDPRPVRPLPRADARAGRRRRRGGPCRAARRRGRGPSRLRARPRQVRRTHAVRI